MTGSEALKYLKIGHTVRRRHWETGTTLKARFSNHTKDWFYVQESKDPYDILDIAVELLSDDWEVLPSTRKE